MKLLHIIEARRNPELNKKISAFDALKKYQGRNDVYVTFVDSTKSFDAKSAKIQAVKFGINTNYSYHTPLGIYAYPIDYVIKEWEMQNALPFADDRPFIWVFQIVSKVLDTSTYTEDDLDRDIERIRKLSTSFDVPFSISDAIQSAYIRTPAGQFWNLTREYTKALVWQQKYDANTPIENEDYDEYDYGPENVNLSDWDDRTARLWRKVLRDEFGYGGVVDTKGIIHSNEPVQGVFFDVKSVKVLELIKNIGPRENTPEEFEILTNSPKMFKKALLKGYLSDEMLEKVLSYKKQYIINFYELLPEQTKQEVTSNTYIRTMYYLDNFDDFFQKIIKDFDDDRIINMLEDYGTHHLLAKIKVLSPEVKQFVFNNAVFLQTYALQSDAFTEEEKILIVERAIKSAKSYSYIIGVLQSLSLELKFSVYKNLILVDSGNIQFESFKDNHMIELMTILIPGIRYVTGANGVINALIELGLKRAHSSKAFSWGPLYSFLNLHEADRLSPDELKILKQHQDKLPKDVITSINSRLPGFFPISESIDNRASIKSGDWGKFTIPVSLIQRIYDPFKKPLWGDIKRHITKKDIDVALAQKRLTTDRYEPNYFEKRNRTQYHINRIAYLVKNPDNTPIDIVATEYGSWRLDDGNHRLAAAIYRKDKNIRINFEGSKEDLILWLGVGLRYT